MVRIKIKLNPLKAGSSLEVNSLLNTGFGTEEPEVLIPVKVAERLSFWPKIPEGAEIKTFETAGGSEIEMAYIPNAIEIQALGKDEASKPIKCALIVSKRERKLF